MRSLGLNITPVVLNLIILNAIFFFGAWIIDSKFGSTIQAHLCLYQVSSDQFNPYQLITYAFLHANFQHLLFNMLGLWSFGTMLETVWGGKRFLIFYMFCVLGGAVMHNAIQYIKIHKIENAIQKFEQDPNAFTYRQVLYENFQEYTLIPENQLAFDEFTEAWEKDTLRDNQRFYVQRAKNDFDQLRTFKASSPMLGASGAVFGILLGVGLILPNAQLSMLFLPIRIKAKYFVIVFGALEFYYGTHKVPGDNVAHFGHIGGMIFGMILILIWYKNTIFKR
ncbi:MAG: rhomboid family intramembrane serine protease [Bacteroidia bacterium]